MPQVSLFKDVFKANQIKNQQYQPIRQVYYSPLTNMAKIHTS